MVRRSLLGLAHPRYAQQGGIVHSQAADPVAASSLQMQVKWHDPVPSQTCPTSVGHASPARFWTGLGHAKGGHAVGVAQDQAPFWQWQMGPQSS